LTAEHQALRETGEPIRPQHRFGTRLWSLGAVRDSARPR
jgi:hypothetical protein